MLGFNRNPQTQTAKGIMASAIVFNTENTGEIVQVEMNNEGTLCIGENEYYVDKTHPVLLTDKRRRGGGLSKYLKKPKLECFYLLKTDTVLPLMNKLEKTKEMFNKNCPKCGTTVATYPAERRVVTPYDAKFYKAMLTPKMLKDTADLRFLKQLKKYSEPDKKKKMGNIMLRLIIVAAVLVGGYFLLKQMGMI
jgi:hypothetical protein